MSRAKDSVVVKSESEVAAFLDKVRAMPPATRPAKGRLIFAMDATMSRQPSWDRALAIQSEMFSETAKIGGLDVQLVYFRGFNECRASKWVCEPQALAKLMSSVSCQGGHTQIAKILSHVRQQSQTEKVDAVVYVGDAMEENLDEVCQLAGEIGLLGTKIFTFQEGQDSATEKAYRAVAKLSAGAYFPLGSSSAAMLREVLSAVAVYAAGGRKALQDHAQAQGGSSLLLLKQLTAD